MKNTTRYMHPQTIRIIRPKEIQFIRPRDLQRILNISGTTIWRMEKCKKNPLPPKRRISSNSTGWLYEEIEAWLRDTPPDVSSN